MNKQLLLLFTLSCGVICADAGDNPELTQADRDRIAESMHADKASQVDLDDKQAGAIEEEGDKPEENASDCDCHEEFLRLEREDREDLRQYREQELRLRSAELLLKRIETCTHVLKLGHNYDEHKGCYKLIRAFGDNPLAPEFLNEQS